jgi:hypothetical protein
MGRRIKGMKTDVAVTFCNSFIFYSRSASITSKTLKISTFCILYSWKKYHFLTF